MRLMKAREAAFRTAGRSGFGVFADDVFEFLDGAFEGAFLVLDDVVIDICVLKPRTSVVHTFFDITCFRLVAALDAGFQYLERSGHEDGDDAREETFGGLRSLILHLPESDLAGLFYPREFFSGHSVEVMIVGFGVFEEFPFLDPLEKGFARDEVVRMTLALVRAHGTGRRRDDAFQRETLRQAFDDGILSGTGRPGNEEDVFHTLF